MYQNRLELIYGFPFEKFFIFQEVFRKPNVRNSHGNNFITPRNQIQIVCMELLSVVLMNPKARSHHIIGAGEPLSLEP